MPRQSLNAAAVLLHKAADVLETDELSAVHLIRQVISVLKHPVIPSLMDSDATLVPITSPSRMTETGIPGEDPGVGLISRSC
jgi:hypothetical protein